MHDAGGESRSITAHNVNEILRRVPHVQEHWQTRGLRQFELPLEPLHLSLPWTELQAVIVQPALADSHHSAVAAVGGARVTPLLS